MALLALLGLEMALGDDWQVMELSRQWERIMGSSIIGTFKENKCWFEMKQLEKL